MPWWAVAILAVVGWAILAVAILEFVRSAAIRRQEEDERIEAELRELLRQG